MSSVVVASGGRRSVRRLRLRHVAILLSLVLGWVVAAASPPAYAAPTRVAKCPACAADAANVTRLANLVEARQKALDEASSARRTAGVVLYEMEEAYNNLAYRSFEVTDPHSSIFDLLAAARTRMEAARATHSRLAAEHRQAAMEWQQAVVEFGEAMGRLAICEAQHCQPPGAAPPPAVSLAPPAAAPLAPGAMIGYRTAACLECSAAAARFNEVARLMNYQEEVAQGIRNDLATNARAMDSLRAREVTLGLQNAKVREHEAAGKRVPDRTRTMLIERQVRIGEDRDRLTKERQDLQAALDGAVGLRNLLNRQLTTAGWALDNCEQRYCRRAAGVAPVASPAPVQTATPPGQPAPPGTTPGPQSPSPPPAPTPPPSTDKRHSSRAEVQVFGGLAVGTTRLNLTGIDDFFGPGAELFDRRTGSATQVAPALGAFARVYLTKSDPGDIAPAPRFFFTAGALFTPGRGSPGFDSTGINTVPLGTARTETSRSFLAPIMVGVQFPVTVGTTPLSLEVMGGIALGHDTTRVNLQGEGGAPGGPGASGEASGLFVDPVVGFGISAPIAAIEGLGPVRLGVMGLAVIGTGGRSVRVQSPNFGSQSYTGEHRRQVEFFFGATLSLGLF